jgi:hypothetical protein
VEAVEIAARQVVGIFAACPIPDVRTMFLCGTGNFRRTFSKAARIGKSPQPGHQAMSCFCMGFLLPDSVNPGSF